MKRLVLTSLIALVLGSSVAMADRGDWGGSPEGKGRGPQAHLQAQLNLTDAQVQQLQTLRDEQKKQMDAARVATQSRIAQLLTADQATKFKDMSDKMEQRRADHEKRMSDKGEGKGHGEWGGRGHGGHGRGGHEGAFREGKGHGGMKGPDSQRMVDRLKQDLNLTTEQVTQVQIILKDQQAQMDAFRKASKDKLVQMLTAEQATKFQTLESDRKQRMQQNIQEMQQRLERM